MTRLITSWAWGSRAMALSFAGYGERLEHVVAAAGLEVEPALVVARGLALALRVRDLGDELGLELAPGEAGFVTHRHGHAEDAALPRLVEDQLAVLPRQRRLAGHVGDLAARDGVHRTPLRSAGRGGRVDRHADHRVTRDQLPERGLAQAFGAGGPLRKNQVPELGARVPDPDLHALGQVDAELAQHHARLPYRAGAVLERLVPDWREPDESVRIARAERADDEVVDAGRVLDHLEVDPAEAKLFDGRRPVGEEPLAVRRIDPGAGDDLGAVVRPDVLLVGADDAVDGLARDELLLDEQRLEGADPEREDGFRLAVMVPVFVVGAAHDVLLAGAAGSR